jgi:hypothetical protein
MIRWYCCAQEEDAAEAIIKNGFRIDAAATPGEESKDLKPLQPSLLTLLLSAKGVRAWGKEIILHTRASLGKVLLICC